LLRRTTRYFCSQYTAPAQAVQTQISVEATEQEEQGYVGDPRFRYGSLKEEITQYKSHIKEMMDANRPEGGAHPEKPLSKLTEVQRQSHVQYLKEWKEVEGVDAVEVTYSMQSENQSLSFTNWLKHKAKKLELKGSKFEQRGSDVYLYLHSEEVEGLSLKDIRMLKAIHELFDGKEGDDD